MEDVHLSPGTLNCFIGHNCYPGSSKGVKWSFEVGHISLLCIYLTLLDGGCSRMYVCPRARYVKLLLFSLAAEMISK